jgi:hypothetical protein
LAGRVLRELLLVAGLGTGLIPSWADDPAIGYCMINARSETAATKWSISQITSWFLGSLGSGSGGC